MTTAEGRLQIREWKDRDGNNRRTAEVVADNVYFADSKRDAESGGSYTGAPSYGSAPAYGGSGSYGGGYAPASSEPSGFAEIDDQDGDLPF